MTRYVTMTAWAHYEEDGNLLSVGTVRPDSRDVRPGDLLRQVEILVPELPEGE